MNAIPYIKSLNNYIVPITRLSPSSFNSLEKGCTLRYILSYSIPYNLKIASNKNAILGTIAHKLFELRRKGYIQDRIAFKNKWKELVSHEEEQLKRFYPSMRNFSLADFQLCIKSWEIAKNIVPIKNQLSISTNASSYGVEKSVRLGDVLYGKIDSVNPIDGGVEIVDFKTGNVYSDSGKIKDEYVYQLNLYALMYEYTYNISVKQLNIIDINGQIISVPRLDLNQTEILNKSKGLIAKINSLIEITNPIELCEPNESCRFCNCRHLCPDFYIKYNGTEILKGIVESVPNRNVIKLSNEFSGETIIINGFDALDFNMKDYIGKRIIFLKLFQRDGLPLSLTKYTLIFCEDEK